MHPMSKPIRQAHYEVVSKPREVLCIKGHFGPQTSKRVDPSALDILPVNILPNNPIHLLLIRQEVTKSIQKISKWGKAVY
jgi:hypothetical protein